MYLPSPLKPQRADPRGDQTIQSWAGMPLEPLDALITLDREPAKTMTFPFWFRVGSPLRPLECSWSEVRATPGAALLPAL